MVLGDIAYPTRDMSPSGRTLGTEIDDIQRVFTSQKHLSAALDIRETVITVLITHDEAHDRKEIGRMDSLTGGIPGRQTMPDIGAYLMNFAHLGCKITKILAYVQKKV
jgi:hypothetical protein